MGREEIADLGCERKTSRHWNGADFTQVAPNGIFVEQRRGGMAVDAVDGDLKKTIRPLAIQDLGRHGDLLNCGHGVHARKVQFPKRAAVPRHPCGCGACVRTGSEVQLFGESESRKSPDTAKATVNRGILGAAALGRGDGERHR